MPKPDRIFDRETEWADLERFVASESPGPRLGLVYGRRRMGKTFLLRALAAQTGGLYHQALEEERDPALARVGALVAKDAGLSGSVAYADWTAALTGLLQRAGPDRVVVLDEFPYLVARSPELPSAIQAAFDDAQSDSARSFRLLLCGSAMSVMSRLLAGQQALRGRVSFEMVVKAFDFREAARFWGIADPQTALLVHSVVGGTPGYRALLDSQAPQHAAEFGDWLGSGVLNPSSAMFREAEYLLTEDPAITDRSTYQSVLGAIADGRSTRNGVGSILGRDDSALRHPLLVLERAGFIRRDEDMFRNRRPLLRIEDPLLRFHFAVVRRDVARFEARETVSAWRDALPTFRAQVLGPHFEQLARVWTERFASERTLGGRASRVGFAQINDAADRSRHELDVVAVAGGSTAGGPVVLAVGEAKGGDAPRTLADLRRLERGRALLASRADWAGAAAPRLLLFARSGFDRDLRSEAARRSDVELVDLDRLYGGD